MPAKPYRHARAFARLMTLTCLIFVALDQTLQPSSAGPAAGTTKQINASVITTTGQKRQPSLLDHKTEDDTEKVKVAEVSTTSTDILDVIEPPAPDVTVVIPPAAVSQRANRAASALSLPVHEDNDKRSSVDTLVSYIDSLPTGEESQPGSAVSPVNVVFRLNFDRKGRLSLGQAKQAVHLGVDYSNVSMKYGGDFVDRLALYEVSGCTFDEQNGTITACQVWKPLQGWNDSVKRQLIIKLDASTLQRWASGTDATKGTDSTLEPSSVGENAIDAVGGRTSGPILALAAGAGSPTSDYGAIPAGDIQDFDFGLVNGSAQTSYTIPLPPPAAGDIPDVDLLYDSSSVDGVQGSKHGQPGAIGVGWSMNLGAIVRLFKPSPTGSGNLCLTNTPGGDYLFSMRGKTARLVQVSGTSYRLRDDPYWKFELSTSTVVTHPDVNKQYWLASAPDGTKYYFGSEVEPETGADMNSAFWVPSYDTATGSSCNGTLQNRAWQWNLDRIVDPNGNVVSFFYEPEFNYYSASGVLKQYVRAGLPRRIEYTKRTGTAVQPHARVLFHSEIRCSNPASATDCDGASDTPTDLNCDASSCAKTSPTFWTWRRLHAVLTEVFEQVNSRWTTAGLYELSHSFPIPPIDASGFTSTAKLWLDGITQRPGGDYALSAFNQIEAEYYDAMSGIGAIATQDDGSGYRLNLIHNNDWAKYNGVDFGSGAGQFLMRVLSRGAMTVEVRLDNTAGTLLATIAVPNLNTTWSTFTATMPLVTGTHDLYLVFKGTASDVLNVNWFRFTP
ncbi:MAG: carbohydrate-binding protein, partial [Chloroflexi bacterium]|nr:carbohydrate-binding protein [Chloroflexota bacterium]